MDTPEDLYAEEVDLELLEGEQEADIERIEEGGGEEQPAGEDNEGADAKPVKAKRVIRNPQAKLNAETLKGKRGLTTLESYFDRVKYKGHGYEEQDLQVVLKTYEYWCHRLFPKYPFDECIAKIETLGNKKPVVTHIKKIRADLIFEDEPLIPNDNVSGTDEIPNDRFNEIPNDRFNDLHDGPSMEPQISEEQREIIRINKERAERIREEKRRQRRELAESMETDGFENTPIASTPLESSQIGSLISQEQHGNLSQNLNPELELTEEQLERIRLNKERAEKRRQEKLKQRRQLTNDLLSVQSFPLSSENEKPENLLEGSKSGQNESTNYLKGAGHAEPLESQDFESDATSQRASSIIKNDSAEVDAARSQIHSTQKETSVLENDLPLVKGLEIDQQNTVQDDENEAEMETNSANDDDYENL